MRARHFRLSQISIPNTQLVFTFFPPSPPAIAKRLAQWEVVSSYSSATAPDSHGISCADPLFQARKELHPGVAACALPFKIYLSLPQLIVPCVFDCFFS
jgi:hypothetical protein